MSHEIFHAVLRNPTGCIVQEQTVHLSKTHAGLLAMRNRDAWDELVEMVYNDLVDSYLQRVCLGELYAVLKAHTRAAREMLLACGYTIAADEPEK